MTTRAQREARRRQELDELVDRCFHILDADARIARAAARRHRDEARLMMYSAAYKKLAMDDPRRPKVRAFGLALYQELYG